MISVKPFKALRPDPQLAKKIASKPYDVLNSKEAREEVQGNANSFLHVTKSEVDLPEEVDVYSQKVYDKAKENLEAFIHRNILFIEDKPCYYIYQLVMDGKSQTGLVCLSSVSDYKNDLIKKHEFTRPDKELDRINHIKATGAQTGNVFLAYKSVKAIDDVINEWKQKCNPVYDFIAEDSIQHTLWVINNIQTIDIITDLFKTLVPCTYIADGHHRVASAVKVYDILNSPEKENAAYFLSTLFPSDQVRIMDYNRVVKDLNGLTKEEFLLRLQNSFLIEKINHPFAPESLHQFGMYLSKQWYKLTARDNTYTNDPVGILDITILSNNLLSPILNIKDQRTDKRIDFVGGIRGLSELEKRVDSGEMEVAFNLYPVSIRQLFNIADSGNIMPPKSTWFEPKLRDGLLTNLLK